MHFEFTVSIGQVAVFLTLLGAIWKFNRLLTIFSLEHEILVEDYVVRKQGNDPEFIMPTRVRVEKTGWWRR